MSRAAARVGVGTRFRYDGETVEVVEAAATTAAASARAAARLPAAARSG